MSTAKTQHDDNIAPSVARHSFGLRALGWSTEGEVSVRWRYCEFKQDLDIGSFQYLPDKEKVNIR